MRRKALSGHGRPVNAGPSERRWSEGTRHNAPGRIEGQAFLVIFAGAGHPATGKSNSPGRAKPYPSSNFRKKLESEVKSKAKNTTGREAQCRESAEEGNKKGEPKPPFSHVSDP